MMTKEAERLIELFYEHAAGYLNTTANKRRNAKACAAILCAEKLNMMKDIELIHDIDLSEDKEKQTKVLNHITND